MEPSKKELDIVKFNQDFNDNDKQLKQFQENKYQTTTNTISREEINPIEKNILKMRLAFDHIINKIEVLENPIQDITNDDELMQGTIILCLFVGLLTMILSGLMKE